MPGLSVKTQVRPPGAAALASVDLYWLLFVRGRPPVAAGASLRQAAATI
jgi:hypothetical protein